MPDFVDLCDFWSKSILAVAGELISERSLVYCFLLRYLLLLSLFSGWIDGLMFDRFIIAPAEDDFPLKLLMPFWVIDDLIVLISGSSVYFLSFWINFDELAPWISEFLGFLKPLLTGFTFFWIRVEELRFWGDKSWCFGWGISESSICLNCWERRSLISYY